MIFGWRLQDDITSRLIMGNKVTANYILLNFRYSLYQKKDCIGIFGEICPHPTYKDFRIGYLKPM